MVKQDEVSQLRQIIDSHQDTAESNKAACKAQLQVLEKQVAELRHIIDSSMHTKRASTLKLETAMNALNLSKGDAKRFIEVCLLQSVTTAHDSILCTTASCANDALCVQGSCCNKCTDASVQAIIMV